MNITLLFFVGIAAIVAWWLSQQRITAKPWLEQGEIGGTGASSLPAAKVGLGVFLAVVSSLFALFFSAYVMRMEMPDWRPLPVFKLLWINTGLLLASSVALTWAQLAARRGESTSVKASLLAGSLFGVAFLAGQLIAWRQFVAAGYFLATNPANAFFYVITGIHGLHVLGGLVALGKTTDSVWRGIKLKQMRSSVELCTIYWHFLLIVWVVFFALLTGWAGDFIALCRSLST